jgi:hypothetical protein
MGAIDSPTKNVTSTTTTIDSPTKYVASAIKIIFLTKTIQIDIFKNRNCAKMDG